MRLATCSSLLFFWSFAYGYVPGETAYDVDSDLTTFFAECATGEDANTNVYDSVADWTDARVNDSAKTYHCIEAGDYEGHADFDITVDDRIIGFYDDDLSGFAKTCGEEGTFYETPGWSLIANGYSGSGINGAFANSANAAIFEGLDIRGDGNIIFCLTLTDPDLDGPSGPLINVRANDNILVHNYAHDPAQQNLIRIQQDSRGNFVQYNVVECEQSSGTRRLSITGIVDNSSGDQHNNIITSNELFNCGDGIQTLENASDPDNATDYHYGLVVENNDIYVLPELYIDCGTGAYDPQGECACAENAVDVKVAVQNGEATDEISGTAWAATTSYGANAEVAPTSYSGFYARVIDDGGTSGGSEPTWPTVYGAEVTDNDITWQMVSDRHAYRGNLMWGFRPLPAAINTNCPNLRDSGAPAITIHQDHGDYVMVTENLIWDSANAIWYSGSGSDHTSIVGNIFWDIGDKGCNGESSCLDVGVMNVGKGDEIEIYHNLVVESDGDWLDTTHGGDDADELDARGNLIVFSGEGSGSLGAQSNISHNAWLNTSNTTAIGTDELLDATVATHATSTGYSIGDLIISGTGNGAIYEAQGTCTSDGTAPSWTTGIGDDITDNDCTWTVVRAPLVFKKQRWTNPQDVTIPYAVGGAAESPLAALPGDVNQGCDADPGVSDAIPPGVTC